MRTVNYAAIAVRVSIAVLTRTFFQPDEYFQSLEPAHHFVFGYGHLTWEWLGPTPIRSIVYPALNVPIYWMLKTSGLSELASSEFLLILCPRLLHGALASLTDIWVCEIARVVLGVDYMSTTMLVSLSSFFHALSLSRSLINSLETSLSTIAFAYYPWDASSKLSPQVMLNRFRLNMMIIFSALTCMNRPPNAVMWFFLYANLLWSLRRYPRLALKVFVKLAIAAIFTISFLIGIDSCYYRKPTFTTYNFLKVNLSSVSLFYGSNPWHYYITQAVPILCTTALPYVLHGIWLTMSSRYSRNRPLKTIIATIAWVLGVYSLAGHKEWRFLHPILPLLHILAAKSLVSLSDDRKRGKRIRSGSVTKPPLSVSSWMRQRLALPDIPTFYLVLLVSTIPVSLYIILLYCSGPISVLSFVRSIPRAELGNSTIGFLMPCHSTPGQAYVHRGALNKGGMWSLGCEPPLENQELSTYKDQTNVFFEDPKGYLLTCFPERVNPYFPPSPFPSSLPGQAAPVAEGSASPLYPWRHEWPRYLIFFGKLLSEPGVREILHGKGYKEVWGAGREWEGADDRKGGVKVWKWIET